MENKRMHLELVQGVINRMASNSFMLKGWAVTLVTGVFALAAKDTEKLYFLVAYVPIIVFWGLDAYYLRQEKLYRALYDQVRKMDEKDIDFSLSATTDKFKTEKNKYCYVLFSLSEILFYLPLAVVCGGIIIITPI